MRRTCNFPPPDSYDPVYQSVKQKEPTWVFGSSKRKGLKDGENCSPSMQTYNIPQRAVEGSQWIMGLKLDNQGVIGQNAKQKVTPGAGTYDPDYKSGVT